MHKEVCGYFSANHLVDVVIDLYPGLVHGVDFLTGHYLDPDDGTQNADPFFLNWKAKDIPQPDPAALKDLFYSNEVKYRTSLARRFRDSLLEWSDGRAEAPSDAPENVQAKAVVWREYRQALRDLTELPDFPLDFTFPVIPA